MPVPLSEPSLAFTSANRSSAVKVADWRVTRQTRRLSGVRLPQRPAHPARCQPSKRPCFLPLVTGATSVRLRSCQRPRVTGIYGRVHAAQVPFAVRFRHVVLAVAAEPNPAFNRTLRHERFVLHCSSFPGARPVNFALDGFFLMLKRNVVRSYPRSSSCSSTLLSNIGRPCSSRL
jgi:hypothetical protein